MARPNLIFLALLLVLASSQKSTTLSYLVDYQEEEQQDFIQLTVSVSSFKQSLQEAIAEAREKAEQIKTLEEDICRMLVKNKNECKGSAEIGNLQITPKYEEEKKDVLYKGITAMYEVVITVTNTEHFGDLVDKILTLEGFIISKIEWKPDEDKEEDTFMTESLQKSKEMCKDLGLSFKRLISVEEVREEPPAEEEPAPEPEEGQEEEEEEEPQEEEEPEEEEDITTYRITVECGDKKGKKEEKVVEKKPKEEKKEVKKEQKKQPKQEQAKKAPKKEEVKKAEPKKEEKKEDKKYEKKEEKKEPKKEEKEAEKKAVKVEQKKQEKKEGKQQVKKEEKK